MKLDGNAGFHRFHSHRIETYSTVLGFKDNHIVSAYYRLMCPHKYAIHTFDSLIQNPT